MKRIGIILGSTRDDRAGLAIAQWVTDLAQGRDVDYELIDLKAFDVPVLTSSVIPMAANKKTRGPECAGLVRCDRFL